MKNLMQYVVRWSLLVLLVSGCGLTDLDVEREGTVRFVDVEGGCWVIDEGSVRLEPMNLDESFRVDGLRVSFRAQPRTDLASICQVGVIVELLEIRALDD